MNYSQLTAVIDLAVIDTIFEKNKDLLKKIESIIIPVFCEIDFSNGNPDKIESDYKKAIKDISALDFGFPINFIAGSFKKPLHMIVNNINFQFQIKKNPNNHDEFGISLNLDLISIKYNKKINTEINVIHEINKNYLNLQINDSLNETTYNINFNSDSPYLSIYGHDKNSNIINLCSLIVDMANNDKKETISQFFLGKNIDESIIETYYLIHDKKINGLTLKDIQINEINAYLSLGENEKYTSKTQNTFR